MSSRAKLHPLAKIAPAEFSHHRFYRNSHNHFMLRFRRFASAGRPPLKTLLPSKKIVNRILFDEDSRLPYRKIVPILEAVYTHLDAPDSIRLPSYTKSYDVMMCKTLLYTIRNTTNTANRNLVALENELVQQAAELGDNDAITMLAFETISGPSTKDDFKHANKLIAELTDLKHPLVFKMAGDLAFKKGLHAQAHQYWLQFLDVEADTIMAANVYASLGIYFFQYARPINLPSAKDYFLKSIKYGELDSSILQAHYYVGQMYSTSEPEVSRYHLEIAASKGLVESFTTLGFLEMNMFRNFSKALEWFKLGVEATNDLTCLVGQFDCYVALNNTKQALNVMGQLAGLRHKLKGRAIPKEMEAAFLQNKAIIDLFFDTRAKTINSLRVA